MLRAPRLHGGRRHDGAGARLRDHQRAWCSPQEGSQGLLTHGVGTLWLHQRIAKVGRDTSGDHLVPLLTQDACSWAVSISPQGDTVASLGNPGHCLATFTARKQSKTKQKQPFFLVFKLNFLCFRLCPLSPVPSLDTAEKSLALPSSSSPPGICARG